ncbi:MAG: WbqC family protein [Bacteroidota bacterium]|nr:WbqC family protein [Bacteroidota bacterium]
MKYKILIENQYFGCVNYYSNLYKFSNILIEQYESWQKMSFRNRCVILGANGLIDLTVPLENGREQKKMIRDVKIDNHTLWQKQHWRSISSCYGKSAFFEFYKDWLESFYEKKFVYLFDMDLEILFWLKSLLKIKAEIEMTDSFIKKYQEDIVDLRNKWLPKNFQSSPNKICYNQVFEAKQAFQPNLSILDILFCEGPNAKNILSDNNVVF